MRNFILGVLAFSALQMLAQSAEPMFQTTFYFEDAIGNRDTIIIGADTAANNEYNPLFGENDMPNSFDSIFEVRATHAIGFNWGQPPYILSKKIVGSCEPYINLPQCFGGGMAIFFVRAKYQPITIRWDMTYMDNLCNKASFLTPDKAWELVSPFTWFENPIRYGCASKSGSYTLSLGDGYKDWFEIPYAIEHHILGSSNPKDSIYGVCFSGFWADWWFSPCSLVGSEEPTYLTNQALKIVPNPVVSTFRIDAMAEKSDIIIYSSTGVAVKYFPMKEPNLQIDVGNLPSGMYYIRILGKSKTNSISQFVKL